MFTSVYRLQVNEYCPFSKVKELIGYFTDLGVEGIYFSPYMEAYSLHGYDVLNPSKIHPKIGTEKEFEELCALMQENQLAHIVDVVPNHMGIQGRGNSWWQEVLKKGPHSRYANFFDINWRSEKKELQNKVLIPFLRENYGTVLKNKEIVLHADETGLFFSYYEQVFPLSSRSIKTILDMVVSDNTLALLEEEDFFEQYSLLWKNDKEFRGKVLEVINTINQEPLQKLKHRLLEKQYYRVAHWRVASHEINYRRFFNIHEYAALRIEDPEVLETHHQWIFQQIEKKRVQGLRIDHPDGLYDPAAYFQEIKKRADVLVIVEKILDRDEKLPKDWKIDGSTGYEYLNLLTGLFIRKENEHKFTKTYEKILKEPVDFEEILYKSKKIYTHYYMASEMYMLGVMIDRIAEQNPYHRDFTRIDLIEALAEIIAALPVYRTYIAPEGLISDKDQESVSQAVKTAKKRNRHLDDSVFDFIHQVIVGNLKISKVENRKYRNFVLRFQQLTGPIMAKGLEDTSFYVYNLLFSLNEVGADPTHFGYSIEEFHLFNSEKHKYWPKGFLPSSTHDTKSSEDVRMRINVLTELCEEWDEKVSSWIKEGSIDRNTQYFIFQMLIGAWPKETLEEKDFPEFIKRIWPLILKSLREAEQNTNWLRPNEEYEKSVYDFFTSLFADSFLLSFIPLQKKVDKLGSVNTICAQVIRLFSVGIVDIYQGNELFTYSLVDPDNRRLVCFDTLKSELAKAKQAVASSLFAKEEFALLKMHVLWKLLSFRKQHREFILSSDYLPLEISGEKNFHILAFARSDVKETIVVIVSRFHSEIVKEQEFWQKTRIRLPFSHSYFTDLFLEKKVFVEQEGEARFLSAKTLFDDLPFCVLHAKK